MKKIIFVILIVIAAAMPSMAQFSFGLKGGLNLTKITVNNSTVEDMFKNKTGFFIGPTIKFSLPVVGLSLDAAALYDQRQTDGEVYATFDATNTTTEKIKQQTIQIPINVRYGFGLGETANIFIFAGPQFGFNVGDKSKDLFGIYNWTMRSSNVSANVGLGALLLSHLQLTVNYNIALGKTGDFEVFDAIKKTWNTVTDGKTNAWQIAVAYYF